MQKAVHF